MAFYNIFNIPTSLIDFVTLHYYSVVIATKLLGLHRHICIIFLTILDQKVLKAKGFFLSCVCALETV